MLHSVLGRSLRDQRVSLPAWCGGLLVLAVYITAVYPSVKSYSSTLQQFIDQMPAAVRATVMGDVTDYTSPAGYLQTELYFVMLPLLFLFFGIGFGSRAVAGEEDRHGLELVLTTPISRRRYLLEEFGGMCASMLVVAGIFWLGLTAGAVLAGMDISPWLTLQATAAAALLGLCFGSVALAVGAVRGGRGLAIGVSAALAVAAYLLNAVAPLVGWLEGWRFLSPFHWYFGNKPLENGMAGPGSLALLVAVAVLVVVAVGGLERRDIAV